MLINDVIFIYKYICRRTGIARRVFYNAYKDIPLKNVRGAQGGFTYYCKHLGIYILADTDILVLYIQNVKNIIYQKHNGS